MSRLQPGPHELGQNFLHDTDVISRIVSLVAQTSGTIVEWGTGDGALTVPLAGLNRALEGIEIDPDKAKRLGRRFGPHVCISEGDILRHAPPPGSTLVSNVPFHLTTPVLRHLLLSTGWVRAILVVQWEVARKRAGVGGSTQLTAQWWPWYEFRLEARVPAASFSPMPSVDGGILRIDRRSAPLLSEAERQSYQGWVKRIFSGRGRTLQEVLAVSGGLSRRASARFCRDQSLPSRALPRDLTASQWIAGFEARRMPL
jgi:23S rRNA (adenine-N6)-dimethyltransferase